MNAHMYVCFQRTYIYKWKLSEDYWVNVINYNTTIITID